MARALSIPLIGLLLATAALFLVGLHVYITQRLVFDPALPGLWRPLCTALVVAGCASFFAAPLAERRLPRRLVRFVTWPAALWMGIVYILIVVLAGSDLVAGLARMVGWLDARENLAFARWRAVAVLTISGLAALMALRSGLSPPAVKHVVLALPRWPRSLDGFRIAQISDIHIGPILDRRFSRSLTERVNDLNADLVAITGDLVDGRVHRVGDEVEPFADLRGRHGVYFVTGNHDHMSRASEWTVRIAELGVRVLRNEHVAIESDGASFDLVGVDDHRGDLMGGEGGEDLEAALAGRNAERFALLLAHDPSTFKHASLRGIDLQLSGHTHGGQIWPFGYAVRLVIPFVAGCYQLGPAQLYVSRGSGFWGPPMRLFAPAEITAIELRSAECLD